MTSINKNTLYSMLDNACSFIEQEYKYINKLNVFPVPDGDTGSNMMNTLKGAVDENKDYQDLSLYEFTKKFSRSLLMNAHGNSGVILSQILKGFFSLIKPDDKVITIEMLIDSFTQAKETAYKVVDKPKEGTILSVIRIIAEYLQTKKTNYRSIEEVFLDVISCGDEAVQDTPNFLAVLRKANVVDSGAYGLMIIFKGMYDALISDSSKKSTPKQVNAEIKQEKVGIDSDFVTKNEEGFGYCCELIIEIGAFLEEDKETKKVKFDPTEITNLLNKIGDSLVFIYDNNFCKIHIHTLTPNKVLEIGQKYGEFHKVKIDNMTLQRNKNNGIDTLIKEQNKEILLSDEPVAVATAPTQEIVDLLKSDFNVQYCINRFENQNPSVNDFVKLIKDAKSKRVFLIIDNSDCKLAAKKASEELKKAENIETYVVTCKDILQSIFVLLSFDKYSDIATTIKNMTKVLKNAVTLKITNAVKNISTDDLEIIKNDFILLDDKGIIFNSKDLYDSAKKAIDYVIKKKKHKWHDSIYLISCEHTDEELINKIKEYGQNMGHDVEVIDGGQDKYKLYIGA